jgi:pimeloyl-ACP methyl ester carboxylesterase
MRDASTRPGASRAWRVLAAAAAIAVLGACETARFDAAAPEVHDLVVNGAQLSYVEQGAGETVVFVHGIALDWRSFEDVRPYITTRYRFVAYSRRHHAPNRWPDEGATYGIVQHAEDLAALIRALGVAKAHVVGTTLGGRVAARLAMTHPELVASLVINDAFLTLDVPADRKRVIDEFSRGVVPVFDALRAGDDLRATMLFADWEGGRSGWFDALPEYRKQQYRDNAKTLRLAARDEEIDRRPSCQSLHRLAVPVLVLEGDHTDEAARVSNDALVACLPPGAGRARVPRSGHFWYVENPRDGAESILRFLAKHPIPPR